MSAPVRIQLRRTKGWRLPPNSLSVARPGCWGNPWIVGKLCTDPDNLCGPPVEITDAAHAVALFRRWIERHLIEYSDMLKPLRGKNLACWCALDQPCHADVLLELANREPVA